MIPSSPGQLSHKRNEKLVHAENENPDDKITKVRPLNVWDELQAMFSSSQDISVDEAVIQFDGRLKWKQYLPNKPVK